MSALPLFAGAVAPASVTLVIRGAPCTKKTSQQIAFSKKRQRHFVVPSSDTKKWTKDAQGQLQLQYRGAPMLGPVRVGYRIYREANRGDLGGFEAALDDAMQGIVYANDSQIIGRLWSEKLVDRVNPRVEIEVRQV